MSAGISIISDTISRGQFNSSQRTTWQTVKGNKSKTIINIISKFNNHNRSDLKTLYHLVDYIQLSINNDQFAPKIAYSIINSLDSTSLNSEDKTTLITSLQILAERSCNSLFFHKINWFNITSDTDHIGEIKSYLKNKIYIVSGQNNGFNYKINQINNVNMEEHLRNYNHAALSLRLSLGAIDQSKRTEFFKKYFDFDDNNISSIEGLLSHLRANPALIGEIKIKQIQENKNLITQFELLFNDANSIKNGNFVSFTNFIAKLYDENNLKFPLNQSLSTTTDHYTCNSSLSKSFTTSRGEQTSLTRKYGNNQVSITPKCSYSSTIFEEDSISDIADDPIGINYNQTQLSTNGNCYPVHSFGAYQKDNLPHEKSSEDDAKKLLTNRIFPGASSSNTTVANNSPPQKRKILIEFRVLKQLFYPFCADSQIFDKHCDTMRKATNTESIDYYPIWINSYKVAGKTIEQQNPLASFLELCNKKEALFNELEKAAYAKLKELLSRHDCYASRSMGIYLFSLVRILAKHFPDDVAIACGCKSAKDRTASLIAASNLIIMLAEQNQNFDFIDGDGYLKQGFLNEKSTTDILIKVYINDPLNRLVYSYTGIGRLNNKNLDLFHEIFKKTRLSDLISQQPLVSTSA